MRYGLTVAVILSSAVFRTGIGPAAAQEDDGPLSRSLTVEQTAIYDVRPPVRPADARGDGLEVLAWVDRPEYTYASGEEVQVFVETNKDAYVTVLNVDPAGETTVLFPNRYQSDNRVAAGRTLQVPDPAAEFRIVVSGDVGTELLKVIASMERRPLLETLQMADAGPFQVVRAQPARLARSLTVVMSDSNDAPSASSAPVVRPTAGAVVRPARPSSPSPGNPPPAADVTLAAASGDWAVCHQAITTVPVLSAAARRTRSLTVQRTQASGMSVTCEEAR